MRRLASLIALLVGGALLVASAFAARPSSGWTLRIESRFSGPVDPANAPWELELAGPITYATCLKLVNHRGGGGPRSTLLVPEAAPLPQISRDGRRYTFTVAPRFTRFSNGERVGPRSFARAFVRTANVSPGGRRYVRDLVGANFVLEYGGTRIQGVDVRGDRLVLRFVRHPGSDFLARLALPYFCALPRNAPLERRLRSHLASAGPYYVSGWNAAGPVLRRNPYYRGRRRGAGPARVVFTGRSSAQSVVAGRSDWLPPRFPDDPAPAAPGVRRVPVPATFVLVLASRPGRPFANRRLRHAVAYGIDRASIMSGHGIPSDGLVTTRPPGYPRTSIYPARPTERSRARARELARGLVPLRIGNPRGDLLPELRESLAELGIDLARVNDAACDGNADLYALYLSERHGDPASVFRFLLDPGEQCYWPGWLDKSWRPQLERALRLRGKAKLRALASLERRLLLHAQIIGIGQVTEPHVFSPRIGCFRSHRVYQVDIVSLCLR
jgi:hypothetical protein